LDDITHAFADKLEFFQHLIGPTPEAKDKAPFARGAGPDDGHHTLMSSYQYELGGLLVALYRITKFDAELVQTARYILILIPVIIGKKEMWKMRMFCSKL
jgi:hypothetical protein